MLTTTPPLVGVVVVVVVALLPVLDKALRAVGLKDRVGLDSAGLGGALPVELSTESTFEPLDGWYERNHPRALAAPTRPVPVRLFQAYEEEEEVWVVGALGAWLDAACADEVTCNESGRSATAGLTAGVGTVEVAVVTVEDGLQLELGLMLVLVLVLVLLLVGVLAGDSGLLSSGLDCEHLLAASVLDDVMVDPAPEYGE